MENITDAASLDRALNSSLDPKISALLTLRRDQLLSDTDGEYDIGELAHWIIVAPGDPLAAIEAAVGFPIAPAPPWEFVIAYAGFYEAPTVTSDSGFGVVLIVPDDPRIDPILLSMLRRDAQSAEDATR